MPNFPGTPTKPFKVAIVGGGPAGVAVLVRATRLGLLKDLLEGSSTTGGVVMLEAGNEDVLGVGRLGGYQINSNTYASKFATNVVYDRLDSIPPEIATGTPLEPLRQSPTLKILEELGNAPAPLPVVGKFLGEVGCALAQELRAHPESAVLTRSKVLSATIVDKLPRSKPCPTRLDGQGQQVPVEQSKGFKEDHKQDELQRDWGGVDGVILGTPQLMGNQGNTQEGICVQVGHCHSGDAGSTKKNEVVAGAPYILWRLLVEGSADSGGETCSQLAKTQPVDAGNPSSRFYVYTTKLVVATGGCQAAPILPSMADQEKLLESDFVLQKKGLEELQRRLVISDRPSKLCVIGGGHSAFSVVLCCLNMANKGTHEPHATRVHHQESNRAVCSLCTTFPSKEYGFLSSPDISRPPSPELQTAIPVAAKSAQLVLEAGSITMLCHGAVKVFYPSQALARKDGYTHFTATNKQGQIHPFGGLRGDAAGLYHKFCQGGELRMKMYQVKYGKSKQLQKRVFDEVQVIVWAGGYCSNTFPLLTQDGSPVRLHTHRGQVSVDDQGRLWGSMGDKEGGDDSRLGTQARSLRGGHQDNNWAEPLPNVFGIGLGFGLSAKLENGELDGSSGRADGVAVYQKRSASLILASILGVHVFGEGMSSWEDRTEECRRRFGPGTPLPTPARTWDEQLKAMTRLSEPQHYSVLESRGNGIVPTPQTLERPPTKSPAKADMANEAPMGSPLPPATTSPSRRGTRVGCMSRTKAQSLSPCKPDSRSRDIMGILSPIKACGLGLVPRRRCSTGHARHIDRSTSAPPRTSKKSMSIAGGTLSSQILKARGITIVPSIPIAITDATGRHPQIDSADRYGPCTGTGVRSPASGLVGKDCSGLPPIVS